MKPLARWINMAMMVVCAAAANAALRTLEFEGAVTVTSGIGDFLYPVGSPMKAKVTWEDSSFTTQPFSPTVVYFKFPSSTWSINLNGQPRTFTEPLSMRWQNHPSTDSAILSAVDPAGVPGYDTYDINFGGHASLFSSLNYQWSELQHAPARVFQSSFYAFDEVGTFLARPVPEPSSLLIAIYGVTFWIYARRRVVRDGKRIGNQL